jgi:membrane fusion protein, multidrug efflux system
VTKLPRCSRLLIALAAHLLELEENRRLRLVVAVPESEVSGIVPAARVAFTVPAYPGQTFTGSVARMARSVDPKTRTTPVELDVDNQRGTLSPGMYAEVSWPVHRPGPSLLVQPSSIVTTTERVFVIRVNQGRAEYVSVSRGAPAGDLVEVFGGLRAGDQIVRRATDEIREGTALAARGAAK